MAVMLRAPAKVNLGLRVLGKRPDDYHELDTVFHALELHDDLFAQPRSRVAETGSRVIELQIAGADLEPGPDNLVHRAAVAFFDATSIESGVRFFLDKRIPLGAGLGGGSSDAAAALRLLHHLHPGALQPAVLQELAAGLGADVGFFVEAGTQRGRGRGELLTRLAHPELHFLLILPPFGTSTTTVYKNYPAQLISAPQQANIPEDKAVPSKGLAVPEGLRNDLECVAMQLYPELRAVRERIFDAGISEVRMSGSGSTLYTVSENQDVVRQAECRLRFLEEDGVRLLRTRSADDRYQGPCAVPWPAGKPRGNEGE